MTPGRSSGSGGSSDDVRAFLVGSSVVTSIITIAYVGAAYATAGRPDDVAIEWMTLVFSLIYGAGAVIVNRVALMNGGGSAEWAWLVGAAVGLLLSVLGRFGADLPRKIFGMRADRAAWRVHVIAPIMYAFIFRLWVYPLLAWTAP